MEILKIFRLNFRDMLEGGCIGNPGGDYQNKENPLTTRVSGLLVL